MFLNVQLGHLGTDHISFPLVLRKLGSPVPGGAPVTSAATEEEFKSSGKQKLINQSISTMTVTTTQQGQQPNTICRRFSLKTVSDVRTVRSRVFSELFQSLAAAANRKAPTHSNTYLHILLHSLHLQPMNTETPIYFLRVESAAADM